MANTAFQTQYRQEFIAGFEQRESLLRNSVTTEAVISGNTATFLVADSGSSTAVTRGADGLIPSNPDNLSQPSATLVEWHDRRTKTNFNIFAGQGDQRRIMQMNSMGVINRKIDTDILTALDTATQQTNSGTAAQASLDLVMHAQTILGNNEIDTTDGMVTFVISPAFQAYLNMLDAFSSADFASVNPMNGQRRTFGWLGFNWIVHPNLTGKGTASEKCFAFHKSAIGHAADTAGIDVEVGYNGEHKYSFATTSIHMGSKVLQNSGIVEILHDGSAFAA